MQHIVEKAASDSDFGQQLLSIPKPTICDELGIKMPESMAIPVHESDMQAVHLALPPDPNIFEGTTQSDLRQPLLLLIDPAAGESRTGSRTNCIHR